MSSDISILTDEPTSKGLLDFDKYSIALANVIRTSSPRFTVGIFGGWGTGKTTLMQMIKGHLDPNEDILTVWFNAWRYEREQYLAAIPLLRTITLRIEGRSKFAGLKSALVDAIAGLVSATKVGLGPYNIDLDKLVKGAKKHGLIGANVETLYYDAVEYLNTALLDLRKNNEKRRLVIFIDDLDRCNQERALEVVESIKAFLDIQGIIFVLGMNENTINAIIKKKYGENSYITGFDYLKKIIQLPFYIPDWSESDLSKFLASVINTNPKSLAGFSDYKDLIIRAVEWNPREVKRFLNYILLTKTIFDKPMDSLIVVQALRFNTHWNWLLNYLLNETTKRDFLNECEMFLADKTRDLAQFHFKGGISLLAKDELLQNFLQAGALRRLQLIGNFEEYRRALATVARTPSIWLSTTSGSGAGLTTGIKVSGTGFPRLAPGTGIVLYFISAGKILSVSGATQVSMYSEPMGIGEPTTETATVDGSGNFQAYFETPNMPGDAYSVFVTYTPSGGSLTMSPAVIFQITPYLDIRLANEAGNAAVVPTSRSARLGQWARIRVYGFGASEMVTITGLPVAAGTALALATNANGAYSKEVFAHLIGETTPGSKTVTAVGSTSGVTATRLFTILP